MRYYTRNKWNGIFNEIFSYLSNVESSSTMRFILVYIDISDIPGGKNDKLFLFF